MEIYVLIVYGFDQASSQELFRQMADQNSRLLLILERLSIQQAAPAAKWSSEQIVESLSSTIKEFCYDPAAGMTFDRWFHKYEDLFSADGKELDDAAKIRLLLRSLSVPVHEKFTNFLLPQHPRDFTFDEVVTKLKAVFGQQKSLFSKRYDCFRVVKNDADDYVTYAGIVNRQCEDFDLAKLTIDQFKALIFVCGMQSPKEAEVRTRLLSKLESDDRKEVNLEALITECQRLSNLKHDTALVEKQSSSSVKAVQHQKQQYQPKQHQQPKQPAATSSSSTASVPRSPCWQCGGMHFVKECSYTNHVCKQCSKQGHKEGYCNCFNKSVSTSDGTKQSQQPQQKPYKKKKKQNQANSIFAVNQVHNGRKYVTTRINGHTLKLQLDCGSDITIIAEQSWKRCGSPALTQTESRANTASGEQLHLLGEFTCTMQIGEEQRHGTCYVTSVAGLNLLGLDFINAFDLWAAPLTNICNQVNRSNSSDSTNQFLTRFPEVFRDSLGLCTKTKVKLYLKPDARPVFRPKRPVPFHAVPGVDAELDRLIGLNILTPVDYADWAAPIVSVRKPGGNIRICADYSTGLNAQLEPNYSPLPTREDIFSKLSGSTIFTIVDLSDAYLQVEVDDESKQILTINTHRGLFLVNRLQPGIKTAPGVFQQLMGKMIAGLEGVANYLDDFIVYSATREQHDRILEQLFNRIQEYGFHLRPEKCSFYQPEIRYLGFIINADGIKPDPEKVAAISSMPQPKDVSELRSFLGAANFYGNFVREIHRIRKPLDELLKKDKKFVWSAQCEEAFQTIKKILQSDLLLTHYDPSLEIIVAGDASKTGIGAVIMHRFPDGQVKAIAHASKSLTSSEQNYSQVEKEALALIFAVKKFRRMILGRPFKLQTDHQPLLKIFGSKKGIPLHTANRLQRWALALLGYDFVPEYISTDKFGYADVLSRLISNHPKPDEEYVVATVSLEEEINESLEECFTSLPVNFKMVSAATKKDAILQQVIQFIDNGWPRKIDDPKLKAFQSRRESLSVVNGCIMMEDRVVVPEFFSQRILKQLHRGHQGMERTKAIARSVVYWPNIDSDIEDLVRRCDICASAAKSPPHSQPQPWPRADGPWKRIHLDYAGPLEGMSYLVIVDSYSKWPEIFQTRSTTAAVTIRFLQETFARFGIPETVITDNGTQFCSSEFKQMCEQLGIIHIRTAPYHPQSNGQAERFVDTLKRSLRKIVEGEEVPSAEALQTFLQVYRSTPSATLAGKSPAEAMLGRSMRTTLDMLRPPVSSSKLDKQCPKFTAGSTVHAKLYDNADKWKWIPGTVIEAIGGVMFNILLEYQCGRRKLIRSHVNQLRPRFDGAVKPTAVQTPLDILVGDFDLKQQSSTKQATPRNPPPPKPEPVPVDQQDAGSSDDEFFEVQTGSTGSAVSTPATVQPAAIRTPRPARISRPPVRLADYVVG